MQKQVIKSKKIPFLLIVIYLLLILKILLYSQTPVDIYGQLRVQGKYLVDKNGNPVVLRGLSLFWSCWGSKYWNADVINWVATDWRVNVIRAAMGVEPAGGYLDSPTTNENLVNTVVQACINRGIYVIIDWHDHNAPAHQSQAIQFFQKMAQRWGSYPNVIYEIFNEPDTDDNWSGIKNYAQAVISAIRQYDPDNVILVGTPNWCQDVDTAAQSPLTGVTNVMYTLHFYAASHGAYYRQKAQTAINAGLPIFVSEFGTCEYTGDGRYNFQETDTWINFLEQNYISWVNWSLNDKQEAASVLVPGASTSGGWTDSQLTESGKYIRNKIRSYNQSTGGIAIYLTSCSSGSIVWSSTNIAVNITAGNPISKVEFYIDGTLKNTDTSSPYSYTWNTTEVQDGWHSIKITAYDSQNTQSSVNTSVIVYNANSPTINLSLQDGAIIYGAQCMVSAEVNKGYEQTINKVEFYLNSTKIGEDTVAPYTITFDTTKFQDGDYTLRTVAYDKKGQQGSKQISVKIKNTDEPPSVSIISPQNGQTVGGTVNIQVDAQDDRSISKVEFYIDNIKTYTDAGRPYSWNWDTTQYSEGPHTIKVVAYDSANQTATHQITLTVSRNVQQDNPPSVDFISPTNGATISGVVSVSIYASDDKGVQKVELYINNTKIVELTTYPYTYSWNTQNYQNGSYTLKAVAYDTNNQSSQKSIVVNVSNQSGSGGGGGTTDTPPSISIVSPQNNAVIDATLNLTVNLDDDKGLSKLEIYLNSNLIGTYTSIHIGTNNFQIDLSFYNNEQYILKAVVYDNANNTSESSITIKLNNSSIPPLSDNTMSINTSLFDEAVLKGIVDLQISVYAQNGISKIELYLKEELIDGIEFQTGTPTSYNFNYSLNTTKLPEGKNELKIVLYDTTNSVKETTYSIEIDNFKDTYICSPNNDGINDFIKFDVHSEVLIFDTKGKLIKIISTDPKIWDATSENGQRVKPGLYIYKILEGTKVLAIGTISVVN